jgi:hypothetical protein
LDSGSILRIENLLRASVPEGRIKEIMTSFPGTPPMETSGTDMVTAAREGESVSTDKTVATAALPPTRSAREIELESGETLTPQH